MNENIELTEQENILNLIKQKELEHQAMLKDNNITYEEIFRLQQVERNYNELLSTFLAHKKIMDTVEDYDELTEDQVQELEELEARMLELRKPVQP